MGEQHVHQKIHWNVTFMDYAILEHYYLYFLVFSKIFYNYVSLL